jgi:methanogenic corrinoid protein MtbC1
MLLHVASPGPASPGLLPNTTEIAEFARIMVDEDVEAGLAFVDLLRARGATPETLLLHLLSPAARLLGDLWRDDLLGFGDVTIGLSRLQQILHRLGSAFHEGGEQLDGHGRRALLASVPGEQHSFGLGVVEEFLRRDGWEVHRHAGGTERELVRSLRGEWFDLVGFSLSGDVLLGALASAIQNLRRASRNRAVKIMVGGRYFNEHPEMVARVGADATAEDGKEAVTQSRRLVGLPARLGPG